MAVTARKKRVIRENRQKLIDYLLKHPCVDCGETDILVLQFDHVRGKKCREVSCLVATGFSWAAIEREIEKCEVRCANDHLRRTAKTQKFFKVLVAKSTVD